MDIIPLPFSSSPLQGTDISLKGVCTHIWYPISWGYQPRDEPLNNLALIANWAYILEDYTGYSKQRKFLADCSPRDCVHESHRREGAKKGREVPPVPCSYTPGLSTEGAGKKAHLQFFHGGYLATYFPSCCLRVWLPNSLHLGADCDPPLWYTDCFGTYSTTESHNECNLDNHKGLGQPRDWYK